MIDKKTGASYLFCSIGWMEYYKGQSSGDSIRGGGAYVEENKRGGEVCNFLPYHNKVYGYVRVPQRRNINIDRLGANGQDSVSGVTVIWVAKRPKGGRFIVGWYKDATVYREPKEFNKQSAEHKKNYLTEYSIDTKAQNAKLLPVDERTFLMPRGKGWIWRGLWHADLPENRPLIQDIAQLINGSLQAKNRTHSGRGSWSRSPDPKKNKRVEKSAIDLTCEYYTKLGYSVTSVEKDNVGWDLEAKLHNTTLKIEVKGLSGNTLSVELTPNEYKYFAKKSEDYRLCVVYTALTNPTLMICRYSKEKGQWVVANESSAKVKLKERIGASVTINL